MTYEEAVALFDSGFWHPMCYRERAVFQLYEKRLCMPFEVFHEAIEKALERPVWTHELALNREGLKRELMGDAPAPTFAQIVALIPPDKRMVILLDGEHNDEH